MRKHPMSHIDVDLRAYCQASGLEGVVPNPQRVPCKTLAFHVAVVFVCLLCAVGNLISQEPKTETRTRGYINGHGWAVLSDDQGKFGYFLGLMDGWKARQEQESSLTVALLLAMSTDHISLQNAVELINEGYRDPANSELPVWWVFMAEVHIKRGDMPPDKAFTALRHLLTQINASTEVLTAEAFNQKFSPVNVLNASAKEK